jgi:NADPH:quinone reductase-like Zn-dependent oxidoreductase
MRATASHGRHDIRFETAPVPTPGAGELLLEVRTVGVCGSAVGGRAPVNEAVVELAHRVGRGELEPAVASLELLLTDR